MAKKLYFRYGAMNSGKSTALLQAAHNYEERGQKVLIIKPKVDTKDGGKISSRLGISRKCDYLVENDLFENITNKFDLLDYDCILVDEVQFLKREDVDDLMKIVVLFDIPVMCYGLRLDFAGNGFEGSTRLLEIADHLEELRTICRCGSKATHNIRKVNGVAVFDGDVVVIDNSKTVEYEGVCAKCFHKAKYGKEK